MPTDAGSTGGGAIRPGVPRAAGPGLMRPLERVAVLLTLMRELQDLMRQENELLRELRLGPLPSLQADKALLAEAYAIELQWLRRAPEAMGELPPEAGPTLEQAMRDHQAAVRANLELLEAARPAVEAARVALEQSLATLRPRPPRQAAAGAARHEVIALEGRR